MFNVHFTAVTNETKRNWRLTKTNGGMKLINPKSKVCESSPMETQNRLQQFLRKSEHNPNEWRYFGKIYRIDSLSYSDMF